MAYLIFTMKGREVDRGELTGPATVGRSHLCDLYIRDIEISRQHCRLEPTPRGWVVTDLSSRNGTRLQNKLVKRHLLRDGDTLLIGQTWMTFHSGEYVSGPQRSGPRQRRPADPVEAMVGTVTGFRLPAQHENSAIAHFPRPRPRPCEPAAYVQEDVQQMLSDISSSAWDDLFTAERGRKTAPARLLPRPIFREVARPQLPQPYCEPDLSLQVHDPRPRRGQTWLEVADYVWRGFVLALTGASLLLVGG